MKRTLFFILGLLPLLALAQPGYNFLEKSTITVEKTGINTPSSDFGPAFVRSELWYSTYTLQPNQKQRKKKGVEYYELFASPVDGQGALQGGKSLQLDDQRAGYNAGPVSFSETTRELFVTVNNYEDPLVENIVFQEANLPLRILILREAGAAWVPAGEFPFNNQTYSVGHPALSVTGDTIIFTSDKPGGNGGTDLYMAVRKNGKWSDMKNLGATINTKGDEMFPYLHKGKILFFASDGISGGQGGLDIYYSELTASGFSAPVNLEQVNSAADDFGLVIHPNEEIGYFTSQREGGVGSDDIYKVLFEGNYDLELLVVDRATQAPIANVKVDFSDGKTLFTDSEGIIRRDLERGSYTAATDMEDYMNESVAFATDDYPYGTIKKTISIEKVEVGQVFVLENIYYDFDKWDILPESEVELDKLVKIMKDNPKWKVELGSHTDSRGTHEYNDRLSQKRSDSAVGYIISKGIDSDRIVAKGYGERQLVNECADDVPCSEEQHRQNRRTEFTILDMGGSNFVTTTP